MISSPSSSTAEARRGNDAVGGYSSTSSLCLLVTGDGGGEVVLCRVTGDGSGACSWFDSGN